MIIQSCVILFLLSIYSFFVRNVKKDTLPLVFDYLYALKNKTYIGELLCNLATTKNRKFVLILCIAESTLTASKWYFKRWIYMLGFFCPDELLPCEIQEDRGSCISVGSDSLYVFIEMHSMTVAGEWLKCWMLRRRSCWLIFMWLGPH
jgi:hypothetical protein